VIIIRYKIYEEDVEFVDEDPDFGEHYIYVPSNIILEIAKEIGQKMSNTSCRRCGQEISKKQAIDYEELCEKCFQEQ